MDDTTRTRPTTPGSFDMDNFGSNGNEKNTSNIPLSVKFSCGRLCPDYHEYYILTQGDIFIK
jgi:hypothetical protein